jgi:hypothetical protein
MWSAVARPMPVPPPVTIRTRSLLPAIVFLPGSLFPPPAPEWRGRAALV